MTTVQANAIYNNLLFITEVKSYLIGASTNTEYVINVFGKGTGKSDYFIVKIFSDDYTQNMRDIELIQNITGIKTKFI